MIAQYTGKALKIATIGTGIYLFAVGVFKTYATRERTWFSSAMENLVITAYYWHLL